MPERIRHFTFDGQELGVEYGETTPVKEGVVCDTYRFVGDDSKDLAIIEVDPGQKTPLQRVLRGRRTIEGFIQGSGVLVVHPEGKQPQAYIFRDGSTGQQVEINIGDTMQWTADDTGLTFYEICDPPYEDGRFKNLPE